MKRKDILLIGGNGFVGRHLFKTFSNTELYKVSIIDKHDNPNVQCNRKYIGNIENLDFVNHCIADSNPELIYYLVSNFSITSVDEFADEVKRSIIRINNIFNCLNSLSLEFLSSYKILVIFRLAINDFCDIIMGSEMNFVKNTNIITGNFFYETKRHHHTNFCNSFTDCVSRWILLPAIAIFAKQDTHCFRIPD